MQPSPSQLRDAQRMAAKDRFNCTRKFKIKQEMSNLCPSKFLRYSQLYFDFFSSKQQQQQQRNKITAELKKIKLVVK